MNLWNLRAPLYNFFRKPWPLNVILKKETRHIRELLAGIDFDNGRVLDVGCGVGHSSHLLLGTQQVFAIDKSHRMAARAVRIGAKNVIVAEANFLPVTDNSFDMILAIGLTKYLTTLPQFFAEIKRAGKPDLFFLCTSSPPGIFSLLRNVGGSKVYRRSSEKIIETAKEAGISFLAQRHFFSQDAFLFQILKENPFRGAKSDA